MIKHVPRCHPKRVSPWASPSSDILLDNSNKSASALEIYIIVVNASLRHVLIYISYVCAKRDIIVKKTTKWRRLACAPQPKKNKRSFPVDIKCVSHIIHLLNQVRWWIRG